MSVVGCVSQRSSLDELMVTRPHIFRAGALVGPSFVPDSLRPCTHHHTCSHSHTHLTSPCFCNSHASRGFKTEKKSRKQEDKWRRRSQQSQTSSSSSGSLDEKASLGRRWFQWYQWCLTCNSEPLELVDGGIISTKRGTLR